MPQVCEVRKDCHVFGIVRRVAGVVHGAQAAQLKLMNFYKCSPRCVFGARYFNFGWCRKPWYVVVQRREDWKAMETSFVDFWMSIISHTL